MEGNKRYMRLILGGENRKFTEKELHFIYDYLVKANKSFEKFSEPFLRDDKQDTVIGEELRDDFYRYLSNLFYNASPHSLDCHKHANNFISVSSRYDKISVITERYELVFDSWIIYDERCRFNYSIGDDDVDFFVDYAFYFKKSSRKEESQEIMDNIKKYLLNIEPSKRLFKIRQLEWLTLLNVENYHLIGIDSYHKNEFLYLLKKLDKNLGLKLLQ